MSCSRGTLTAVTENSLESWARLEPACVQRQAKTVCTGLIKVPWAIFFFFCMINTSVCNSFLLIKIVQNVAFFLDSVVVFLWADLQTLFSFVKTLSPFFFTCWDALLFIVKILYSFFLMIWKHLFFSLKIQFLFLSVVRSKNFYSVSKINKISLCSVSSLNSIHSNPLLSVISTISCRPSCLCLILFCMPVLLSWVALMLFTWPLRDYLARFSSFSLLSSFKDSLVLCYTRSFNKYFLSLTLLCRSRRVRNDMKAPLSLGPSPCKEIYNNTKKIAGSRTQRHSPPPPAFDAPTRPLLAHKWEAVWMPGSVVPRYKGASSQTLPVCRGWLFTCWRGEGGEQHRPCPPSPGSLGRIIFMQLVWIVDSSVRLLWLIS